MTKTLETVAREFAEEIKSTIVKALPVKTTNLGVRLSEKDGRGRVVLETSEPIELSCDNRPLLYLAIKYHFTLNGTHSFLKVESSSFCVLPSKSGNPLFRYEYLDAPSDSTPSAHLYVHGHRDEIVKLLYVSERSRSNRVQSSNAREKGMVDPKKVKHLAELHFPLGGPRFRPCLEDVVELLIVEFGVDSGDDWRIAIQEGRRARREKQLRTAVWDDPETARAALAQFDELQDKANETKREERLVQF